MAEKQNNKRHESTIDKYFGRTADGFKAWAEEDEEERNYLQIALGTIGDPDENGDQRFEFHIAYHGKASYLADGIAKSMQRDKLIRQLIIGAAKMYYTANIKIKDNEADN